RDAEKSPWPTANAAVSTITIKVFIAVYFIFRNLANYFELSLLGCIFPKTKFLPAAVLFRNPKNTFEHLLHSTAFY
ncbi:hypothetical protein K0B41_24225, partial [Salmonella enterica subsp. enterica serovar Mbandaka]|nr:hypothetical protein [Salmonella enterica subsp. enterica serovar Mbandaka]